MTRDTRDGMMRGLLVVYLFALTTGIGCVDEPTLGHTGQPVCNENVDDCVGGHPVPSRQRTRDEGRSWAHTQSSAPITQESVNCTDSDCVWHANLGSLSLWYTCWTVETDQGWVEVCWGAVD